MLFVFIALYLWMSFPLWKSSIVLIFLLPPALIVMPFALDLVQKEYPYIYSGFYALLTIFSNDNAMADGSIGPRAMDWIITWQRMWSDPVVLLFGNSPMRAFPEISYIENTATNVLFRFGVVGFCLYYIIFIWVSFKEDIDRPAVVAFIFALFVADCAGNFSESIKFMFLLAVTFGALLARSQALPTKGQVRLGC